MDVKTLFFRELPDPLGRFRIDRSDDETLPVSHCVMDPYEYFHNRARYKVTIFRKDGIVEQNY